MKIWSDESAPGWKGKSLGRASNFTNAFYGPPNHLAMSVRTYLKDRCALEEQKMFGEPAKIRGYRS